MTCNVLIGTLNPTHSLTHSPTHSLIHSMSIVSVLQMATQFVEGLTEFRALYLSHIQEVFESHPMFVAALDKVS